VSFFWWSLVFVGLGILALVFVGLLAWKLWRSAKELGREAARASDSLARIGARAPSYYE
jgi:cbb3-type cytochrome oxidase subunit 3